MRLVTFLGTGNYATTRYVHPSGEGIETCYVAAAIARLWGATDVVVLKRALERLIEQHLAQGFD